MKKAFLFTLIFSFLILKGYSQYEVKIVYHNNDIEEGYADLIDGNSEFVKFKKSKNESFSKIESEKISSITYYNAGFSYTFHYIGIRFLTPITKTKYKEKFLKEKHWAWLKKESSIINCYFAGDYYKLKKDGDITIIDDFKATGYFLIRKNEQFATYIAKSNESFDGISKKILTFYFDDSSSIIEKVNSGDYCCDQILEIFELYLKEKE